MKQMLTTAYPRKRVRERRWQNMRVSKLSMYEKLSFIKKFLLVIIGFLMLFSNAVNAALIFDESLNPDLNGDQTIPTAIGNLELGQNRVFGTHSLSETGIGQGDTFSVILPASLKIVGIELTISNLYGFEGDTRTSADVFFSPPYQGIPNGEIHPITANGIYSFNHLLPLCTPDGYGFSVQYSKVDLGAGADPSYNWGWKIDTAVVPSPPALWLLGSGFLGLLKWARRKT
ncbi:MAG: hypothetical protein KAT56_08005 [Sedimentisphaerales bacterium]|nr:hypothetical protein [Sedimentisphaerales bacterium]